MTRFHVEADLEAGLKYTEEISASAPNRPIRDCCLWQTGIDKPVSSLNVMSFRQRFGSVTVPAEGIGGVETRPEFRRHGYIRKLFNKATSQIAKHVPVIFVSDAIEGMYEKFGYVNCLANGYLSIPVRNVEHMSANRTQSSAQGLRDFTPNDLPAMVALYNAAHAQRPWTHERPTTWNELRATQTWQPGSDVIILERVGQIVGYAILNGVQFGHGVPPCVADEMTAVDTEAAEALLIEVAARCWRLRLSEFWVREPADSVVGRTARRLGCDYHYSFPASGGMMGAITDRLGLLQALEPELRRRIPSDDTQKEHAVAFDALYRGDLLADNKTLLRLLVGFWSTADAQAFGTIIPEPYQRVCDAWFPGGGTLHLLQPYAHTLDRY